MKKIALLSPLLFLLLSCTPNNDRDMQNGTGDTTNWQNEVVGTGDISTWSVAYFPWKWEYIGYFAKPARDWTYPALILIHEWWWLNDNIKSLAMDFAKEGYVVLAADMYWSKVAKNATEAMQFASGVTNNEAAAFDNLKYAVEYLQWLPEVDDNRMWSVGWCFWWWWAYQMAKNNLWTKVSVMYYWRFNPEDDLSMMRSQILGHFWEKDMNISIDTVNEFQAKLKTLTWSHMVYIYPNAGHGFANEPSDNYDEEAANLAWQRTLDFLNVNLKQQ
ncbi:MAG: hypothetical protein ACD_3C00172G0002 [uncultured bacterium (gcode 4)]|uniref:Dienelactone hydrolase domain-containing protein n=1 Tax=uncultured bacterium (gcode 4) TaxID=1234023 RepID=K2GWI6_9BACT|nr:MAG: hypothetical protein ACD_3C00172G0002 [uncultured bacterium (gcode 4)]